VAPEELISVSPEPVIERAETNEVGTDKEIREINLGV
jgi:hypothetical protein